MENGDTSGEVLESNGIRVRIALMSFKGGMKAKVQAIAKPFKSESSHTKIVTEDKGVSERTTVNENKNIKEVRKDVTIAGFPYKTLIIVAAIALLIIIIIFIIKKPQ